MSFLSSFSEPKDIVSYSDSTESTGKGKIP